MNLTHQEHNFIHSRKLRIGIDYLLEPVPGAVVGFPLCERPACNFQIVFCRDFLCLIAWRLNWLAWTLREDHGTNHKKNNTRSPKSFGKELHAEHLATSCQSTYLPMIAFSRCLASGVIRSADVMIACRSESPHLQVRGLPARVATAPAIKFWAFSALRLRNSMIISTVTES